MLWTVALGGGPLTVTAAVLLTTAFDAVFALRVSERPVRVVALVCAFGTGGWGVLAAGLLCLGAAGPSAAARAAALLLLAAVIALGVARFAPRPGLATGMATTAALCAVGKPGRCPAGVGTR